MGGVSASSLLNYGGVSNKKTAERGGQSARSTWFVYLGRFLEVEIFMHKARSSLSSVATVNQKNIVDWLIMPRVPISSIFIIPQLLNFANSISNGSSNICIFKMFFNKTID